MMETRFQETAVMLLVTLSQVGSVMEGMQVQLMNAIQMSGIIL